MADQKLWYKVWTSILSDPDFALMPIADIGRWVLLGAAIALSGTNGSLRIPRLRYLTNLLRCVNDDGDPYDEETIEMLMNFPHILVSESPISWLHGRGKKPVSNGAIWRCDELLNGRGANSCVAGVSNTGLPVCEMFKEWCINAFDFYVTYENWTKYQGDSRKLVRGEKVPIRGEERRGEEKRVQEERKDPASQGLKESGARPFGPTELCSAWNQAAKKLGLSEASLTDSRKAKAKVRLQEHPEETWWNQVFKKLAESPFALGKGEGGWKMNFDKLASNDTVATKILEGDYANVKGKSASLDFGGGSAPPGKVQDGGTDYGAAIRAKMQTVRKK